MGEKGDCFRCYLRHTSCDLRGGRLRFRVRSRHLRLSHWFENAIVDSLVAGLGRFECQESVFR